MTVKRAFKFPPAQSASIKTHAPCWINTIVSSEENRPNAALRIDNYTVRMQFFAPGPVSDKSCDIAATFMEKALEDFDGLNRLLNGTVSYAKLRGAVGGDQELITSLSWAGANYAGLELNLDLRIIEV